MLNHMRYCLDEIDAAVPDKAIDVDHFNRYRAANQRFHRSIRKGGILRCHGGFGKSSLDAWPSRLNDSNE